jgi:hypothetical protein
MRETPASSFFPPIALQKWEEGPVAGMVSEGGEVRMYALCIGSVAATKSAKDKGFSKVFMSVFIRAKVGRKELCQGGKFFFGFLMSGEIFELGDIDEGDIGA